MAIKKWRALVGHTPVIQLVHCFSEAQGEIYLKLERFQLGGSVKDRPALHMIETALKQGHLKPGGTIIEPTSGNTGISLALMGKQLGFEVVIVMPETMSLERRKMIQAHGASLVLTPGHEGMRGAIEKARSLVKSTEGAFMPMQFSNPANKEAHFLTTGPEIYETMPDIDVFVAGVGTGGTLSGVGKYLKSVKPSVKILAVEPALSPVLSGGQPGPHKLQGIGAGFIPGNYDPSVVDEVLQVSDEDAMDMVTRLATCEGLLLGISTAAALSAAETWMKKQDHPLKILVLSPDGGEKYLSMLT